jgi:hypothetical protein
MTESILILLDRILALLNPDFAFAMLEPMQFSKRLTNAFIEQADKMLVMSKSNKQSLAEDLQKVRKRLVLILKVLRKLRADTLSMSLANYGQYVQRLLVLIQSTDIPSQLIIIVIYIYHVCI